MDIAVSDIALANGRILKRKYRIDEVHYLGNFGIVYFGVDINSEEEIVIKEFMPYKLANRDLNHLSVVCKSPGLKKQYENARLSFTKECDFVKRISDLKEPYEKCVLTYIDDFEENDTIYLVTERIHGRCLQEYIENGEDYSIREVVQKLVEIVGQIHKMGIIHCDIKPSNILIDDEGRVVLIDFGSACEQDNQEDYHPFVSRGFSAPELYSEDTLNEETDVYSIGAMLYYMLTDYQLPSPDDYDEQEEIPYISEFTQIDSELEEVIMKSLNRKQNERPNLLNLQIMLKK